MQTKLLQVLALLAVFVSVTVSAGPAPALTSNVVVAVGSTKYPSGEPIKLNYYSTTLDHTGPTVQVMTKEMGYASTRSANLNGIKPSSIDLYPIIAWDRTVVGYNVVYTFRNVSSVNWAKFACSATSMMYPFRTYSCWVNIK